MEGDLRWCCGCSNNNWDLHAVVRFACGGGGGGGGRVTPPPASDESFSWLPLPQPQKHETIDAAARLPFPADPAADDLCLEAALFAVPKPDTPLPASSPRIQAAPQQPPAKPRTCYRNGGGPRGSKRKKKKCQVSKDVTRVAAGAPSPDLWAWRKYGQKPIKGSPYPRGYYRCSTDKNCKARKQVERCRDDPTTLTVCYTGEHSHPVPLHRNSLAGTTRKKPQPPPPSTCPGGEPTQPQAAPIDTKRQGSPAASAGLSPATPVLCPPPGVEDEEEDEEEAVTASLLLDQDVEMEGEDDVLLFLEPALGLGSSGSDCEDAMLFRPEPSESAPGQGNGGGWEDVMLFSKLDEPAPTTSRS